MLVCQLIKFGTGPSLSWDKCLLVRIFTRRRRRTGFCSQSRKYSKIEGGSLHPVGNNQPLLALVLNIFCHLSLFKVFGFILVVAFAHPGYLLFGSVHSSFKSFGDAFLLVTSFFRLEGVARYQDFALEEQTLLLSTYFALFLIGFCVIVRGSVSVKKVHWINLTEN